jgi:hypothetical protein
MYRDQLEKKEEPKKVDDMKMFDDVDSDYKSLSGLSESESESDASEKGEDEDEEEGEITTKREPTNPQNGKKPDKATDLMPPPPRPPTQSSGPKDYFKGAKTRLVSEEEYKTSFDADAMLDQLRKARAISGAVAQKAEAQKNDERQERLKRMLQASSRDDEDMDMGFGSSRNEDEADLDEDETTVKLSVWGDDNDEDGRGGGGGGQGKRKRGAKRRKGDKNSFADVMRVMERQKGEK